MRINFNKSPKIGDKRIRTKFLLFPRIINGEFRWLEFANIKQELKAWKAMVPETSGIDVKGWRNIEWVN